MAYLNSKASPHDSDRSGGVSPEDPVSHYLPSLELGVQRVAVGIPDVTLAVLQSPLVLSSVDGPILESCGAIPLPVAEYPATSEVHSAEH